MDTNPGKVLLLKAEVFQIVGCAIEVLNTLGHGLVEKPYENALVVEFGTWRDVELFAHYWSVSRRHSKFQASQTRMGEDCFIKFVSIRVHSWLIISRGKSNRLA